MRRFAKRKDEPDTEPGKAVLVSTLQVEPREIPERVVFPGRIEPLVDASLAAEQEGRIVELAVERGDRVSQGQVLLRIDARVWDAVRERAVVEAREAGKDLERWKELQATGAVAESEFDGVRTRKDMADIALREADIAVSQCCVRSPIDGTVEDRYVDQGEFAGRGAPVLRVVRTDTVKLVVDVPERDLPAVQTGNNVVFSVAAVGSATFTGRVSFVSSVGAPLSNSFRTEVLVANPAGRLKAGMIAAVPLQRRLNRAALSVPLTAVIPVRGEDVVFVVRDGRAERRIVKIDSRAGHEAVLSSGLEPGDSVVVEGQRFLEDGMPVDVAPANEG